MTYNVTASFSEEQRKLEGTFPVDMYVLNASQSGWEPSYYTKLNQNTYGYEMNSSGDLVATEVLYTGLPMVQGDSETSSDGQINEVTISIPNTNRVIESVIQDNNYLRGHSVHLLTFFNKHLPSGATSEHIGTSPDKFSCLREKLFIDSTSSNDKAVTFICKPKFVLKNVILPTRNIAIECSWDYAGSECGSAVNTASFPTCEKTLDDCKQRGNTERYGGFVNVPRGITIG